MEHKLTRSLNHHSVFINAVLTDNQNGAGIRGNLYCLEHHSFLIRSLAHSLIRSSSSKVRGAFAGTPLFSDSLTCSLAHSLVIFQGPRGICSDSGMERVRIVAAIAGAIAFAEFVFVAIFTAWNTSSRSP